MPIYGVVLFRHAAIQVLANCYRATASQLDCYSITIHSNMLATARIVFNRGYFESFYDDSLTHRLRWRKFAVWLASALTLFGICMALTFPDQWLVGATFACFGVYELAAAITHRQRWIHERIKSMGDDKSVDVVFDATTMKTTSVAGSSVNMLAAFSSFTAANNGFFLVPDCHGAHEKGPPMGASGPF